MRVLPILFNTDMVKAVMDGEEIEEKGICEGYVIWNDPVQIN